MFDFDTHHFNHFGEYRTRHTDWSRIRALGNFFETMPLMPAAHELWSFIKPLGAKFLTGIPRPESVPQAADQKRAMVLREFGNVETVCCRAREKSLYCRPGDVLIDDLDEYSHLWRKAGGIFILHKSAKETIEQLAEKKIFFLQPV